MRGSEPREGSSNLSPATNGKCRKNFKEVTIQEATGIAAIVSAASTVTEMSADVFEMIVANPLLCVFCATSLIGIGISVFKRLKRAAR